LRLHPQRELSALLLALTTCSYVDRTPGDECQEDRDCGPGLVCSLAQGNICVLEELPPQAALGFTIEIDKSLYIELTGCDPEVTRELGGSELRVQKRSSLVEDYEVTATIRQSVVNCGGDECTGVCDEQALTCSEPTDATFTLTMASRLGLGQWRDGQSSVTDPPPPEGEPPPPVPFTWPTYESTDLTAHAALVLDVAPTSTEMDSLSSFRRVVAEDAELAIDTVGILRCQRGLYGIEGGVRTLSGSPVPGATIEFRYAEPLATPSTVIGTAPNCGAPEDCPPGWACNIPLGRCGLDLTGTLAGSTASTEDLLGGYPPAWIYTYCEEEVAPIDPIVRKFEVSVTPPDDSGLPTVFYTLDQGFIDPATEILRRVEVDDGEDGQLCLPDWQPPQPIAFSLEGTPVELIETELGAYVCCSTACLPSTEPGVEPTPPPSVQSCSSFDKVRFETRWFNPDLALWGVAKCIATTTDSDGSNGRFSREVTTCDGGCSVQLTPGAIDDLNRTYSVTVVQPDGSVFQSQRFSRPISAETTEFEPFQLLPRVLLRGAVSCAEGSQECVATNAVIFAERLRVDTDEPDLPEPFYFDTQVDATGNFVLPLDPGVYVITAFPAVGQGGGPSRFEIVDVRDGSDLIEMVGNVPEANLSGPLELEDGILVRVALSGFELSTDVRPLDIGSWKAQSDFPADVYDLNDPQTCYSAVGSGGCLIRRLHPSDGTIPLLASGRFQFIARSRGGDDCK
jgi:hypothetical protein